MHARTPGLIAALCVGAFVTWLAMGGRVATTDADTSRNAVGVGGVEADGDRGSTTILPEEGVRRCEAPVRWSLAEVDPRFGLAVADARSAVEEAASLWEAAAGRRLFQADSAAGLPIRFVYDARQARANERVRLERAFRDLDRTLEYRRVSLRQDRDRHNEDGARYEARARSFEVALAEHNQRVREWNGAGASPGAVAEELREAEEALERTQAELAAQLQELRAWEQRIRAEAEDLASALEERNREADRIERDFPLARVESGAYREVVRQDATGRVAVGPEIRVHLFVTRQELIGVLAHELGHALGLQHETGAEALMNAEHERESRTRTAVRITPADLAQLRARCP